MAEAAKLKASVYRATCDSGGGEGDAAAMIEINEILLEHPHLYSPTPCPATHLDQISSNPDSTRHRLPNVRRNGHVFPLNHALPHS